MTVSAPSAPNPSKCSPESVEKEHCGRALLLVVRAARAAARHGKRGRGDQDQEGWRRGDNAPDAEGGQPISGRSARRRLESSPGWRKGRSGPHVPGNPPPIGG